jgi:hypothetical protein
VLAETMGEALELAPHPEVVARPSQAMWPGVPGERVWLDERTVGEGLGGHILWPHLRLSRPAPGEDVINLPG